MMKKFAIISILILFSVCLYSQNFKEYNFSFKIKDRNELEYLTKIISIDNVIGNTVYAYAVDDQFEKFTALGYEYDLIEPKTDAKYVINMATTTNAMANWDRYPTYGVYIEMMEQFAADYPTICKIDTIGTSKNGKYLLAAKISDNVHLNEAEPEFFYTSTMHGDETTGFILMLRLIDSLLTSYGTASHITNLVDTMELYINPSANPDGTYASGNHTVSGATRSNANGVDLNRNWKDPASGDHPDYNAWQPETVAMMEFAAKRDFVMSANFHGGIELANYPWDHTYRRHTDDSWFIKISRNYATSCQNNSPAGYFNGQNNGITNGADWYVVDGSRQDYMTYFENCREITMEISDTKLLSSDQLRNHWEYNKEALLQYIEEATFGLKGIVTNTDANPVRAMIFIDGHDDVQDSSMVFSNPDHGDYYRLIEDGTYSVTASAEGYISLTKTNITINDQSTTTLNFELEPLATTEFAGYLKDRETNQPIEGAKIEIVNQDNSYSITDASGKFTFDGIDGSKYDFRIIADGYAITYANDTFTGSHTETEIYAIKGDYENFDEHGFDSFRWIFSGDAEWDIDNSGFSGDQSIQSGKIGHNEASTIELALEVTEESDIQFFKKVSSEQYDALKFFIDDIAKAQWAGDLTWHSDTFRVDSGLHTFKWSYIKNSSGDSGDDCAWIDSMLFPVFSKDTSIIEISQDSIVNTCTNDTSVLIDIDISNSGLGNLYYSSEIENSSENTWISLDKYEGKIQSGQSESITAHYTVAGKDTSYQCNIIFTDKLLNTQIIIPVKITVDIDNNNPLIVDNISDQYKVNIFPNPTKNEAFASFEISKPSNIHYNVYSIDGRMLYSSEVIRYPQGQHVIKILEGKTSKTNQILLIRFHIDQHVVSRKILQAN